MPVGDVGCCDAAQLVKSGFLLLFLSVIVIPLGASGQRPKQPSHLHPIFEGIGPSACSGMVAGRAERLARAALSRPMVYFKIQIKVA